MACRRYAFSLSSARPGLSSHSNESTDDVGVGAFDGSGVGRFDGRCEWLCEAEPKDRFTPKRESACISVAESRTYGLCKATAPRWVMYPLRTLLPMGATYHMTAECISRCLR